MTPRPPRKLFYNVPVLALSRRIRGPGIVFADRPDLAFGIAHDEGLAAVVFGLKLLQDLCTGGFRRGIGRSAVRNNNVDRSGDGASGVRQGKPVGCLLMESGGSDHDHSIAQKKLRVLDRSDCVAVDGLFGKAKSLLQPFDCLVGIGVSDRGNGRYGDGV